MTIRSELDALRQVARAAKLMPRRTPKDGAGHTKHVFRIAAADIWCLDSALVDLEFAEADAEARKKQKSRKHG